MHSTYRWLVVVAALAAISIVIVVGLDSQQPDQPKANDISETSNPVPGRETQPATVSEEKSDVATKKAVEKPTPEKNVSDYELGKLVDSFETSFPDLIQKGDYHLAGEVLMSKAYWTMSDAKDINPFLEKHIAESPAVLENESLADAFYFMKVDQGNSTTAKARLLEYHPDRYNNYQACYDYYPLKKATPNDFRALEGKIIECLELGKEHDHRFVAGTAKEFLFYLRTERGYAAAKKKYSEFAETYSFLFKLEENIGLPE